MLVYFFISFLAIFNNSSKKLKMQAILIIKHITISFIRMAAAAASASASDSKTIPLEVLTSIVRKTCDKYNWNKIDSTAKTFLKHLMKLAEENDVSLEDMARSSIVHAKGIDCSSFPPFKWTNVPKLNQRFQNIPYIIHVGDDNITTVIIKRGNVDCPLKEITPDMMHILGYLGVIRVFVKGDFPIPCWPDNIVHMDISSKHVITHLDEHHIQFPKYLQELIDTTIFEGNYTNWLPPTVTKLVSACTQLKNLSCNLKDYNYTGEHYNRVIEQSEYFPIGMNKVIYTKPYIYPFASVTCSEITMPPGTQYLLIGFKRIYSNQLCIKNVKKLFITDFRVFITNTLIDEIEKTNLTLESESDDAYFNYYRQNVEIILEDVEHLSINILNTEIEFLTCIKHVPASLKKVSIVACSEFANGNGIFDVDNFKYIDVKLDEEQESIRKDFESRFPHIYVSTS
jgi:hypothetical protein